MADTILVADDEASIRDLARLYLEKEGFQVRMAVNGAEALAQAESDSPALLVLDLMMPEMDGWEVCRRLRARSDLPILILTARDQDIDKIVALEMGADDYLTKPFNPRELVARVRAILRRAGGGGRSGQDRQRHIGRLTIDPAAREVAVDGAPITLRAREFDLLLALADHPNQVLSRDQLLDLAWGYEYHGQTRTVDVHVAQLRDRLDGSGVEIETVWGRGYKLSLREA
ncbi:MAG: response regulator transcription factor [Candidatus Promineofilum sp.]|nr:response regulator transcription factor [Promineifilum sp.]MBP9657065.1 response regulator transcription factor [Promineifilum sp.]